LEIIQANICKTTSLKKHTMQTHPNFMNVLRLDNINVLEQNLQVQFWLNKTRPQKPRCNVWMSDFYLCLSTIYVVNHQITKSGVVSCAAVFACSLGFIVCSCHQLMFQRHELPSTQILACRSDRELIHFLDKFYWARLHPTCIECNWWMASALEFGLIETSPWINPPFSAASCGLIRRLRNGNRVFSRFWDHQSSSCKNVAERRADLIEGLLLAVDSLKMTMEGFCVCENGLANASAIWSCPHLECRWPTSWMCTAMAARCWHVLMNDCDSRGLILWEDWKQWGKACCTSSFAPLPTNQSARGWFLQQLVHWFVSHLMSLTSSFSQAQMQNDDDPKHMAQVELKWPWWPQLQQNHNP